VRERERACERESARARERARAREGETISVDKTNVHMHRKRCFFHLEKVTVYTREANSLHSAQNVHEHRKKRFTWRK